MRYPISKLYHHVWTPIKNYTKNLIRFISKNDEDDHHFNNPFVIY
ncbi:hypothetical protein [Niastella vici]|nr:hypothetical protein [Niastella vici]